MFLWPSAEEGLAWLSAGDRTWASRSEAGAAKQGGIVQYFRETPEDIPPLRQPSRRHSAADGNDEDETSAETEDGTT
jgi:hypothetical protein